MPSSLATRRPDHVRCVFTATALLAAGIGCTSAANATVLVNYQGSPGPYAFQAGSCAQGNTPATVASGVAASNLIVSLNCRGDATSSAIGLGVQANNTAITATIGFGSARGTISDFSFSEFNNEVDLGDSFELLGQLNNRPAIDLGNFTGAARTTSNFDIGVDATLNPTDTYTFTIESTSGGVYTTFYGFENVSINGAWRSRNLRRSCSSRPA